MRDPFGSATSIAEPTDTQRTRPEWANPEPRPASDIAFPFDGAPVFADEDETVTLPVRTRRMPRGARGAAGLALALVAGFAGGKLAGPDTAPAASKTTAATQPSNAPATTTAPAGSTDLAALYKAVAPSVVQIVTSGGGDEATGSGVIIDAAGTILTNNHVVTNDTVNVLLSDGRTVSGTVAGRDTQWDLAVVRLTNAPDGLVAAKLGDSSKVVTGQTVVAIGAPFGLAGTYTSGIVSAINRTFSTGRGSAPMRGLIQTDAAINPGNSGGPLFNLAGDVIGIATAIESPIRGSVGVGFAVPINQAQAALPALVRGVAVQHPFLGIEGDAASGGGVMVVTITPGTSVDGSGLRAGDVITAIGGVRVNSIDELARALEGHKVGEQVILTVRRGTQTVEIPVTLRATQGG
jgi:S1-C subfamily serine protease